MGRHLLLVVEDTLLTRKKLILAPFFDLSSAPPGEFAVELLRPDGTSSKAQAVAIVPFAAAPSLEMRAHIALLGVDKDSVPIGTAVWTVD
ncbi:MAG TPA: hypothetical protein VKU41_10690 [Polyangiaceae bacterium]|nr:hypothetical protein [Polyangiaceae bacterium]